MKPLAKIIRGSGLAARIWAAGRLGFHIELGRRVALVGLPRIAITRQ